jgi:hypothetical protein
MKKTTRLRNPLLLALALSAIAVLAIGGFPADFAEEVTTANGILRYEHSGGEAVITLCDTSAADEQLAAAFDEIVTKSGIRITRIGDGAFWGCEQLTRIALPAGVTDIGEDAFFGCTALTEAALPGSVTRIGVADGTGGAVFVGCGKLTRISIDGANAHFASLDGVLFAKDGAGLPGELLQYPAGRTGAYTVPAGVTRIGVYAFYGCAGLTRIALPDGLTFIGNRAFYGCAGLAEIALPVGLTSVESRAFYGCAGLTRIVIPEGVTSVGAYAFNDCAALTELALPESVTRIGDRAFYGCAGLRAIALPAGLTQIGSAAFSGTGIEEIALPVSLATMGSGGAFAGMSSLRRVVFAHGMEALPANALSGIGTAVEVHVPMSVASGADLAGLSVSSDAVLYGVKGSYIIRWAADNLMKHMALDGTIQKFDSGHAWKYVPYQYIIETGTYENIALHFEIVGGRLPAGLALLSDGQFHGAPLETGVFTFDVAVKYPVFDYLLDLQELKLTVEEAGDAALARSNDYPVAAFVGVSQDPSGLGDYLLTGSAVAGGLADSIFKVADKGGYNNFLYFTDFWLDGERLTRGPADDYRADPGSTVVTVYAKTFQRLDDGEHTIAAEFSLPNEDANKPEVRHVAAQKFKLVLTRPEASGSANTGTQSEGASVPAAADENAAADESAASAATQGESAAPEAAPAGTGAIDGLPRDANGVYYFALDGSGRPLEVRIDMPFESFAELYFDGALWARDGDYEARAGSTILRVSAERLARAGLGMHETALRFAGNRTVSFAFDLRDGAARPAREATEAIAAARPADDAAGGTDTAASAPQLREESARDAVPDNAAALAEPVPALQAAVPGVVGIGIVCAAILLIAAAFRTLRVRRRAD